MTLKQLKILLRILWLFSNCILPNCKGYERTLSFGTKSFQNPSSNGKTLMSQVAFWFPVSFHCVCIALPFTEVPFCSLPQFHMFGFSALRQVFILCAHPHGRACTPHGPSPSDLSFLLLQWKPLTAHLNLVKLLFQLLHSITTGSYTRISVQGKIFSERIKCVIKEIHCLSSPPTTFYPLPPTTHTHTDSFSVLHTQFPLPSIPLVSRRTLRGQKHHLAG